MYGAWLQAERIAGALVMHVELSTYYLLVYKTYYLLWSALSIANGTYHIHVYAHTDEPTPPALCLTLCCQDKNQD